MKKLLALLLAVAMLIGCCGCSVEDGDDRESSSKNEKETLPETEPTQPEVRGNEIGDLCYSVEIPILTGEGVIDETIDPTKTGTVTVINCWGTWCAPCVNELPHFDEVAEEYGDDLTIIAMHSFPDNENAAEFVAENYPDSKMIFGQDTGLENQVGDLYTVLGGNGFFPYTLILDAQGRITDIFPGAISYEDLKAAVDAAMKG